MLVRGLPLAFECCGLDVEVVQHGTFCEEVVDIGSQQFVKIHEGAINGGGGGGHGGVVTTIVDTRHLIAEEDLGLIEVDGGIVDVQIIQMPLICDVSAGDVEDLFQDFILQVEEVLREIIRFGFT